MIRIDNIKIFEDLSEEQVINKALKKNKIDPKDIVETNIIKKSIDARDKRNVHYNYAIEVEVKDESKYSYLKIVKPVEKQIINKKRNSVYKPIVVGSGPAGLFCALTLVDNGYQPIIIEQGSSVDERIKYIEEYKTTGHLNEMCNVQFGEGGAGTFSDGKLTTGINSPYIKDVLDYFLTRMFTNSYTTIDALKKIDTNEELVSAVQRCTDFSQLEINYQHNLTKFLDELCSEKHYIVDTSQGNKTLGSTLGELSLAYFRYMTEYEDGRCIFIIDQPEDHISNNNISKKLLKYFNSIRNKKQIIMVTHNLQMVIPPGQQGRNFWPGRAIISGQLLAG